MHETDVDWERWGESDPYYGVLTAERFRKSKLTDQALEEFFASGNNHAQDVLRACNRYFGPAFAPSQVFDYGCGVGRVLIPFARRCSRVVGADVSPSMLAEAKRNCESLGVRNAELVASDDALSQVSGHFDLVHSSIVLQHIAPDRGLGVIDRLIALVKPGGVAALHFTYARGYGTCHYGRPVAKIEPPPPPLTFRRRARISLGRLARTVLGLPGPATHEPPAPAVPADPPMMMYQYDLGQVAYIAQRAGAKAFHAEFTDHGGELGVMMFVQKAHA
jgi:SAM-dependent methyltransferase